VPNSTDRAGFLNRFSKKTKKYRRLGVFQTVQHSPPPRE
jgi:hypothetical protein